MTLGVVLEVLHALKLGLYLDPDMATRRHLWTLAHTHGTLFALLQFAFAATLGVQQVRGVRWLSAALRAGLILVPSGFFLGGIGFAENDPGLGIILTPVGSLIVLLAPYALWWQFRRRPAR